MLITFTNITITMEAGDERIGYERLIGLLEDADDVAGFRVETFTSDADNNEAERKVQEIL